MCSECSNVVVHIQTIVLMVEWVPETSGFGYIPILDQIAFDLFCLFSKQAYHNLLRNFENSSNQIKIRQKWKKKPSG